MSTVIPAGFDVRAAYGLMRLIREFEDGLHVACARGAIPGFTHLYAGEEASAVGVCLNLRPDDVITCAHRAHGQFLAKGGDVQALALEIFGKRDGCCGGKGGSMHVADWRIGMYGANGIVGGSTPHALGAAFAACYRGQDAVAVAFGGDGASNQGATFESMNLAKVLNLPVLFVLEDNGYAETTASAWSVAGRPVVRAGGFDIPAEEIDGSDVCAVFAAVRTGVARARAGGGPSFYHLRVPLFLGHYEGDAETYRAPGEAAALRRDADCLARLRERALAAGAATAADFDALDAAAAARVARALDAAQVAPYPEPAALFSGVYAGDAGVQGDRP